MNKSVMRILIKDSIPIGHAVLAAAHASLSGYLTFVKNEQSKYCNYGDGSSALNFPSHILMNITHTELWAKESFRKVVCKVTEDEFNEAKNYGVAGVDYRIMTEGSLGNAEVAIVFKPRTDWELFFKKLPLYK